MPIYGVPRDLPSHGFPFEAIILDDPEYAVGAFDAYMDTSRDYSTWFAESSTRLIIKDVPVSRGKVLGGAVRAQVATRVKWRTRAETVEARAAEFEALFTAKEGHMQKEIARALAWEKEIWQRDRERLVTAMDRERSQFYTKLERRPTYV